MLAVMVQTLTLTPVAPTSDQLQYHSLVHLLSRPMEMRA
jgi:hypothetical protein